MTREDVRDLVEGEAARRIKEVRHLSMLTRDMEEDSPVRSPMMRACVVLFHGHLEGFVKNSSRNMLKFMEQNKIIPLHLSGRWLDKPQYFNARVLVDVVDFLGMDKDSFETKQRYLNEMKEKRDKIAHGRDIGKDVQLEYSDIQEMGEEISGVIKDFEDAVLKIVDNH